MNEYHKINTEKLYAKLIRLENDLPEFTTDFFRGIADLTQIKTRIAYAFDLRIFFYFLLHNNSKFKYYKTNSDFILSDLDQITAIDIEKFSEFLSYYTMPHYKDPNSFITYTNSANGKMRKLSTIRSMYKYFFKKELIRTNPSLLVDLPKLHEKNIIRLDQNEMADLLNAVEKGEFLSDTQMKYHAKTVRRDVAIITLLLGTGIRISECIGLNISDFDFTNSSFKIVRKGGNESILYLPNEVTDALNRYLKEVRYKIISVDPNDQDAFFLSLQKRRMTVSSIEKMLKKYTKFVVPLKNISPHKLRSTYGTNLYRASGDIYLVADVLGHKDVNTTKKHYAAIDEDRRRMAAEITKIRTDKDS